MGNIWIQGAGELASGVALRLVHSGYRVVMAERPDPVAVRRLACFSEAVYSARASVEDVEGSHVPPGEAEFRAGEVVVVVDPQGEVLRRLQPDAVVDARLTKRIPAPLPVGDIPLIGLGPGFVCGENATLIIETHRGARLGEVIRSGSALPNTGIPGVVGGQSARRVVRAPAAGRLEPVCAIGDLVSEGQLLGTVAGLPVISPLDGLVRGLVHAQAELSLGEKVGDIDPRGEAIDPALVSDKALGVAGGVLEALLSLAVLPELTQ